MRRIRSSTSEFTAPGDQGRMGLLTALLHEIGHILGQDHEADGSVRFRVGRRGF